MSTHRQTNRSTGVRVAGYLGHARLWWLVRLQAVRLVDAQVEHLQLLMQQAAAEVRSGQATSAHVLITTCGAWGLRRAQGAGGKGGGWVHPGQQAAGVPASLTQVSDKALPQHSHCFGVAEAHDMQRQPALHCTWSAQRVGIIPFMTLKGCLQGCSGRTPCTDVPLVQCQLAFD